MDLVVSDKDYPARVAYGLLGQVLGDFDNEHGDSWKSITVPESLIFSKADEYLQ